jgi:hypothetical protein
MHQVQEPWTQLHISALSACARALAARMHVMACHANKAAAASVLAQPGLQATVPTAARCHPGQYSCWRSEPNNLAKYRAGRAKAPASLRNQPVQLHVGLAGLHQLEV